MKDQRIVLDPVLIPYRMEEMDLFKDYPKDTVSYHKIEKIMETEQAHLYPKAILKWCPVKCDRDETVWIGTVSFKSRLLYEKLKDREGVFINIVTAGHQIARLEKKYDMTSINLAAYAVLTEARKAIRVYLEKTFQMKEIGELMPGSLPDWPVINNHALFELAGGAEEIGLSLDEEGFIYHINSVAGILYDRDNHFVSCRLCRSENCVGRKAPFSEKAYTDVFGV